MHNLATRTMAELQALQTGHLLSGWSEGLSTSNELAMRDGAAVGTTSHAVRVGSVCQAASTSAKSCSPASEAVSEVIVAAHTVPKN